MLLFSTAQDSIWIKSHYYKSERYITMRDGVRLFTSMYIPKDSAEKHPILLTRTPYSCAPYGENNWRPWWNRFQREYFKEGYIMVNQDMRGRYMSEGEFHIIPPYIKDKRSKTDIDEASDTYDAIDWLVKNVPGNNGKVGVVGISYPGFAATEASFSASENPGRGLPQKMQLEFLPSLRMLMIFICGWVLSATSRKLWRKIIFKYGVS